MKVGDMREGVLNPMRDMTPRHDPRETGWILEATGRPNNP